MWASLLLTWWWTRPVFPNQIGCCKGSSSCINFGSHVDKHWIPRCVLFIDCSAWQVLKPRFARKDWSDYLLVGWVFTVFTALSLSTATGWGRFIAPGWDEEWPSWTECWQRRLCDWRHGKCLDRVESFDWNVASMKNMNWKHWQWKNNKKQHEIATSNSAGLVPRSKHH